MLCPIVGMSCTTRWCRYLAAKSSKLRDHTQRTLSFLTVLLSVAWTKATANRNTGHKRPLWICLYAQHFGGIWPTIKRETVQGGGGAALNTMCGRTSGESRSVLGDDLQLQILRINFRAVNGNAFNFMPTMSCVSPADRLSGVLMMASAHARRLFPVRARRFSSRQRSVVAIRTGRAPSAACDWWINPPQIQVWKQATVITLCSAT